MRHSLAVVPCVPDFCCPTLEYGQGRPLRVNMLMYVALIKERNLLKCRSRGRAAGIMKPQFVSVPKSHMPTSESRFRLSSSSQYDPNNPSRPCGRL